MRTAPFRLDNVRVDPETPPLDQSVQKPTCVVVFVDIFVCNSINSKDLEEDVGERVGTWP